jgi:ketosteroid isomerase-like protein
MTDNEMTDLVKTYFAGVDGEDLEKIFGTMTDDCIFTVETHGVELTTREDIRAMFDRLWSSHAAVQHKDFRIVPDEQGQRIAAQFKVVNTHHDGSLVHKSNCNFFDVRDGLFSKVSVYMAGENTLDKS